MKARDRVAFAFIIGLVGMGLVLIIIIGILAGLGREIPDILEYLASGVFGAFVGYVGSVATHYFGQSS
jgi:hypothetical protein